MAGSTSTAAVVSPDDVACWGQELDVVAERIAARFARREARDRAFRRLSDCVAVLDRWEQAGVGIVLCDFPMLSDLSDPFQKAFIQLVAVVAEIERKLTAQRTREGLAARKARGYAVNQYPGLGFRWERRFDPQLGRHVKVRARDDEERRVMGLIVAWREGGLGWDAITARLDGHDVRTRRVRPWSRLRAQRAFRAELELRAKGGHHPAG
jgi:DNA invertase Pin-like site-specific DNA recombinase